MRKLIILTVMFVCFISSISYASEKDMGIITGMVVDDETRKPVSSAIIALLNQKDSKIMASVASGNDGNFELSHVPIGKYNLRVSSSNNSESKIIEAVEVSEQTGSVKLGQIVLPKTSAIQMEEIKVVSRKLKGEEKIDRTVYTINDDIRDVSTTGLDMLRQVPSVTVDFLNNVMLEGRSDIQFYVDGVKRDKEFVMQLDPQIIDKVELITNPSVKYDPDISGVISIVLKKQGRFGVNGAVTIPVTNPNRGVAQPSANIEYGSEHYRIYAGVFINYEGFDRKQSLISEWDDTLSPRKFVKTSTDSVKWINEYSNYGVDWFINDKTSLNFLGEWSSWKEKSKNNVIDNRAYENNVLNQYYKTYLKADNGVDNYYYSLFLRHQLEQEGCEFTAEAYFNRQSGGYDNKYNDVYYGIPELSTITDNINRRQKVDDSYKTAQLKLDYSFLIKYIKNEIGTRTFFGWKRNTFDNSITSDDSVENVSDKFNYDQWRQAAYYNALGEMKKIKWQLGLTGEYSGIDINDTSHVHNFFLTPQASLQRDFDESGNMKLSYQRRVRRPETYQLDPYERAVDSVHVRKGNPELKPEVENNLELIYSKNFKGNFVSPKVYLAYTNNAIQEVTTTRNDGMSLTTQDNVGKSVEYGLGVNTSFQITGHWRLNGSAAIYNREISSSLTSDKDHRQQKAGYRFDATNTFTLPKDYSISAIAQYYSPSISYHKEGSRDLLVLLGLGKKFSKMAELNMMYVPFIKDFNYSKSIASYPGYREVNSGSVYVKNLFFIEFKYHFNYGKQVKKIERSTDYDKGQSGGGI